MVSDFPRYIGAQLHCHYSIGAHCYVAARGCGCGLSDPSWNMPEDAFATFLAECLAETGVTLEAQTGIPK